MLKKEIVRFVSDNEVCIGNFDAFRKNRRNFFLARLFHARFWGGLVWIQHDTGGMQFHILEKPGETVAHQTKQAVIRMNKIGIYRFDIGWPDWGHVKIAHRQIGENVALDAEIELQMFFGGKIPRELSAQA